MIRIGNSGIDSLGNGNVSSVGGVGDDARTAATGVGQKSDSVNLSSVASLIALAKAAGASRQSKVESLSAEVKSGRYQADTAQVSQAFVDSHIVS